MGRKIWNEIRKTIHVWWFEFRGIVFSSRWVVLSIITFFMIKFYLGSLIDFAQTYELGIYPAGIPFLFADTLFSSLGMFILIFMMSVFPITNHLQQNVLLRSGNRIWANGQMLTIMTLAIVWLAETQIFVCIIFGSCLDFSGWGKVWSTAASGKILEYGFYSMVTVSTDILQGYTPLQAVLTSMLFIWLMAIIFGEIIFCVDGLCHNYLGEILLSIWGLIWLVVGIFKLDYLAFIKPFSPKNWLDISRYVNNETALIQSLSYMIGIIIILYLINRILIHNKVIALK